MKTNWQDPVTSEIFSSNISGLQEAVGKIEDSIGLKTTAETGITLSEVYVTSTDRYRIFQVAEGKRNWVASPAPVIKKNSAEITTGFAIDYGGGAIVLETPALSTDEFTAGFTRTNSVSDVNTHLADSTNYTLERTNKDSEGIFTTITHKRSDDTKILESVLSGGTSPSYTTRTITYFGLDGITVTGTKTYTLSYDVDGVLISEVLV